MSESYVQVAADGSGKKVRNLALTEAQGPDASGNAQADLTRHQQVVTLADERGDPVDRWDEVLDVLQSINTNLGLILAAFETT